MKASTIIFSTILWLTAILKSSEAIMNGKMSTPGQRPFHVAVLIGNKTCGGSIISDTWVLTAAHCVYEETSVLVKPGIQLCDLQHQIHKAVAVIVHEGYPALPHDIALLKVSPAFEWSSEVASIPVAQEIQDLHHDTAEISGWGSRSANTPCQDLETTEVVLRSSPDCDRSDRKIFDPRFEHCTFGSTGPFIGDAGSPLTSGGVQIGIVSSVFAEGTCAPSAFTVYTRVSTYFFWIQEKCNAYDEVQEKLAAAEVGGAGKSVIGDLRAAIIVMLLCIVFLLILFWVMLCCFAKTLMSLRRCKSGISPSPA